MATLDTVKEGMGALWGTLAEGWRHLKASAAGALTHFRSGKESGVPGKAEVDDEHYLPGHAWAVLGGNLFEDAQRLVVTLEVPGMDKADLAIEVVDDHLVISGEKRFSQETGEGRWRVVQCAYGSFRRAVPLPVAVRADQAKASYTNGVLRVELPKAAPSRGRAIPVTVA